jgi:hypothetical protein
MELERMVENFEDRLRSRNRRTVDVRHPELLPQLRRHR